MGLREAREERVLTQKELAMRAGVSPTTIINIETGKIQPHPGTVRKLAEALGMEPSDLARALRQAKQQREGEQQRKRVA